MLIETLDSSDTSERIGELLEGLPAAHPGHGSTANEAREVAERSESPIGGEGPGPCRVTPACLCSGDGGLPVLHVSLPATFAANARKDPEYG